MPSAPAPTVTIRAGVPSINKSLYRELRFAPPPHDPVILITIGREPAASASRPWRGQRTAIVRDVELPRAKKPFGAGGVRADEVFCYQDFTPTPGLSGDRETASAQSAAECLRRKGVQAVAADRTLPLIFWHYLRDAGIEVACDPSMGQMERRCKDAQEVEQLRHAQAVTEDAIRMACEYLASCTARADGVLLDKPDGRGGKAERGGGGSGGGGGVLTSERVKSLLDVYLMERGFSNPGHIVAGGPIGADCHHAGSGELRTLQPIIIDVFPCDMKSMYNGDCTRMVVHGREQDIPPAVRHMHQAVVDAKAAAIKSMRPGVTGEEVHKAALSIITSRGYGPDEKSVHAPGSKGGMPHGTGHGIGLDLKEPPLLDFKGPALVAGDAITVEPGLYREGIGGMRIEDLLIVTPQGVENLNKLPEGLTWA